MCEPCSFRARMSVRHAAPRDRRGGQSALPPWRAGAVPPPALRANGESVGRSTCSESAARPAQAHPVPCATCGMGRGTVRTSRCVHRGLQRYWRAGTRTGSAIGIGTGIRDACESADRSPDRTGIATRRTAAHRAALQEQKHGICERHRSHSTALPGQRCPGSGPSGPYVATCDWPSCHASDWHTAPQPLRESPTASSPRR